MMRFAGLSYSTSNIGDDIQTLATTRYFPRIDAYFDRDRLNEYSGSKSIVIMNGWFSKHPANWPPSGSILPVFVGFHVTTHARKYYQEHIPYFKLHEPIGCRDDDTAEWLRSFGVNAYTTYCSTLTFKPRDKTPERGRPFIVDAKMIAIPRPIRKKAIWIDHRIPPVDCKVRLAFAAELLKFYRDNASVVVTTRLHCALPCLAMNIPVVFFGLPDDKRRRIVQEVGGKIYDRRLYKKSFRGFGERLFGRVEWSPKPADVSSFASKIEHDIKSRIDAIVSS